MLLCLSSRISLAWWYVLKSVIPNTYESKRRGMTAATAMAASNALSKG